MIKITNDNFDLEKEFKYVSSDIAVISKMR